MTPGLRVTGTVGVRCMIKVKQEYHFRRAQYATFANAVSEAMAILRNHRTLDSF